MDIIYSKCKKPSKCKGCSDTFPNYAQINGKTIRLAGRHYCLKCSPYNGKRNNPRPYTRKRKIVDDVECKWCPYNEHWVPLCDFPVRIRNDKTEFQGYCSECQKQKSLEKQNQFKRKIVKRAGNRCYDCKQQFPDYVYDFHHIDPDTKDFKLSSAVSKSWPEIKKELDKCVMLCANCHRVRHHA